MISTECELVDADNLINHLKILKSINVDGVMVDCWWGIVEAHTPQQYNWSGYRKLFQIVRDLDLKLQVSGLNDEFISELCSLMACYVLLLFSLAYFEIRIHLGGYVFS